MLDLKGCGTALVTPFKGGEVDYDAFRAMVRRQVEGGVDFLLPLGTTGETPTLSFDECARILAIAKEEACGRPVIVGGGTNSLTGTVESIRRFAPLGPDAFLIVAPYYNKPTQRGLYEYYKAVAASTDKPVILYNVPGRTGVNILPETVLKLAREVENIIAVKEASGSFAQTTEILRSAPEGFRVLSGDDLLTLPFMVAGACGVISVASNIAPAEVSAMVHAALRGDWAEARALHHRLTPLFNACFVESNPIPAKAALSLMGLCSEEVRLPLASAGSTTFELMKTVISELF